MKHLIVLFTLICNLILSQEQISPRISGIIIDAETREPIPYANIFISQSSIGCASDKNGYFEMRNLPYGRFEIIGSVLGYELLKINIGIYNNSRRNLRFEMYKQPIQLPDVTVSGKQPRKRKRNLSRFKKTLLGTSENGQNTYITNEEVIRFNDDIFGILKAYADEPIKIVNHSLGYNIHYVLEDFELSSNYVKYTGYPHFIEKTATTYHDSADWYDNRRMTYLGSFRHFLTTICENYELTNGDTTKRTTVFDLRDALKHSITVTYGDTTRIEEQGFYVLSLSYPLGETKVGSRKLVNINKFLSEAENINEMSFNYDDYLEVKYDKDLFPYTEKNEEIIGVSWITMTGGSSLIDKQGRYFDIYAIKISGTWSQERVADMLPFDYTIGE